MKSPGAEEAWEGATHGEVSAADDEVEREETGEDRDLRGGLRRTGAAT